jgi:hypothetical protein
MQEGAANCRACGGTSLREPAELLRPREIVSLELFNWRAMPAPLLILLLTAAVAMALFGPALIRALALLLTGSLLVAELAFAAALLVPSVRVLFRVETPAAPAARLLPAARRLLPGGVARRGRVRSRHRIVARQVQARDRRGTYLWQIDAGDFELVSDDGVVKVTGVMMLAGAATTLALRELDAPGHNELLTLLDGDEVEVRGPLRHEQAAAGYRDSAEIEVMRGVPGNPVEIVLDRRRGPARSDV